VLLQVSMFGPIDGERANGDTCGRNELRSNSCQANLVGSPQVWSPVAVVLLPDTVAWSLGAVTRRGEIRSAQKPCHSTWRLWAAHTVTASLQTGIKVEVVERHATIHDVRFKEAVKVEVVQNIASSSAKLGIFKVHVAVV
jgi:hypothetical protein